MISPEMYDKIKLFDKYMITDEIGDWIGIAPDAPKEAKEAYREFEAEQNEAHKHGVKI